MKGDTCQLGTARSDGGGFDVWLFYPPTRHQQHPLAPPGVHRGILRRTTMPTHHSGADMDLIGWLRPVFWRNSATTIILVIVLATLASPNHNWIQNEAVKAAALVGQELKGVRGSQPACTFTFNKLFYIPLAFLTTICLISVICSKMTLFARLVGKMPSFGHRAVVKARILWSLFIVIIDLVWILLVVLFIRSYMNISTVTILNKDLVDKITPSQLFSIFLSATSLVPPIKHFLSEAKKALGWGGDELRDEVLQMYEEYHDGPTSSGSNEKNQNQSGNNSDDSIDRTA
ncbi:hypothetical protein C8J57DRAFT_1732826 [Mycena rebaudengoi]|nr:hypothetical protein C8J57DRAFT_1732826 [Mycena rebaudengoi]